MPVKKKLNALCPLAVGMFSSATVVHLVTAIACWCWHCELGHSPVDWCQLSSWPRLPVVASGSAKTYLRLENVVTSYRWSSTTYLGWQQMLIVYIKAVGCTIYRIYTCPVLWFLCRWWPIVRVESTAFQCSAFYHKNLKTYKLITSITETLTYQYTIKSDGFHMFTLSMLWVRSSNAQERNDVWKPSKPCHVGTHWIALIEYSQKSTHIPGFQWFFMFFALFCIGQLSHQQHKG